MSISINNIPVDVLKEIFSLVSPEEIGNISKVCKLWKQIVSKMPEQWKEKYIGFLKKKEEMIPTAFENDERKNFDQLYQLKGNAEVAYVALAALYTKVNNAENKIQEDFNEKIIQKQNMLKLLNSRESVYLIEESGYDMEGKKAFTQTLYSKRDLSRKETIVERNGTSLKITVKAYELDAYEKMSQAYQLEREIQGLEETREVQLEEEIKVVTREIKEKFKL